MAWAILIMGTAADGLVLPCIVRPVSGLDIHGMGITDPVGLFTVPAAAISTGVEVTRSILVVI
jgi:hypothetical protein